MVQNFNEDDELEICDRLTKIAGIFSFSPAIYFDTSLETITERALEYMADRSGTFKVESG